MTEKRPDKAGPSPDHVYEEIRKAKVIPVVILDDPAPAVPLARSLRDGGIPIIEFTFRSSAAAEAILRVRRELPEMLVGAGTVLTVEQAATAVRAGAGFIVSPGLDSKVVKFCLSKKVAVLPGVCTPTEIQKALGLGLSRLKYFPSEAMGGIRTLTAISAPFPGVRFIPTGGVSLKNLKDYLSLECVLACGGTWLADKKSIAESDWDSIRRIARETVRIAGEKNQKTG